jgi:putative transposase
LIYGRVYEKEALAIRNKRRLNATDVAFILTEFFIMRGPLEFIRSDSGAEFVAKKVKALIGSVQMA